MTSQWAQPLVLHIRFAVGRGLGRSRSEPDVERRAVAGRRRRADGAAVRFNDAFGYRQTQAHARCGVACRAAVASTGGTVAAIEAVENVREVALSNALAGVADHQ